MSACNVGDLGSIPESGRSSGEGNGTPLQYSCLENPMGGGAGWATVHGVAKRWTRLSDFTFSFTGGLDWPLNEGVGMVTMFNFLEELPNCFSDVTAVIYISSVMYEGFNFSTSVLIPGFIKLSLVGVKF